MSNPEELSISELRRRRKQTGGGQPAAVPERAPSAGGRVIDVDDRTEKSPTPPEEVRRESRLERFTAALLAQWGWLATAALSLGLIGAAAGFMMSGYTASLTLVQRDTSSAFDRSPDGDFFKPRQFSPATMVQLMASPELMRRVAAAADPPISESKLGESVTVQTAADRELLTLRLSGPRPVKLVSLLNLYAKQAVSLTREIQQEDSTRLNEFLKLKLQETENDMEKVRSEIENFQTSERTADPEAQTKALIGQLGEVMARLESVRMEAELLELQSSDSQQGDQTRQNAVLQRLKLTREKLSSLLTRYTEAHPEVIAVNAEITELERQLGGTGTNATASGTPSLANIQKVELRTRKSALASEIKKQEELRGSLQNRLSSLSQKGLQYQLLKARQESLLQSRQLLASRQRAAQLYQEHALGYYRVLAEATRADVSSRGRIVAAALGLCAGLLLGLAGGAAGVCLVEAKHDGIITVADLQRVTGLPVLASLGDLQLMSDDEKDRWAFRTWTLINGKLNRTPDRGLVCGFVSANDGEGKTTWIDLLVTAANRRGLRVLKIVAQSSPQKQSAASPKRSPAKDPSTATPASEMDSRTTASAAKPESANAVISNALTRTSEISRQLADPKLTSMEVCLPDWVWNLDHRRQWQAALDRWKTAENVVILVELPPVSLPESMLLAENVPQLIWLAASGLAGSRDTRMHLETLKHARCQIVGTVLNRNPAAR